MREDNQWTRKNPLISISSIYRSLHIDITLSSFFLRVSLCIAQRIHTDRPPREGEKNKGDRTNTIHVSFLLQHIPSSLLIDLSLDLSKSLSKQMVNFPDPETSSGVVKSMSSLSLFVGGGIQQENDAIREAFALLQLDEYPNLPVPDNSQE
jgi:hypothetical protein